MALRTAGAPLQLSGKTGAAESASALEKSEQPKSPSGDGVTADAGGDAGKLTSTCERGRGLAWLRLPRLNFHLSSFVRRFDSGTDWLLRLKPSMYPSLLTPGAHVGWIGPRACVARLTARRALALFVLTTARAGSAALLAPRVSAVLAGADVTVATAGVSKASSWKGSEGCGWSSPIASAAWLSTACISCLLAAMSSMVLRRTLLELGSWSVGLRHAAIGPCLAAALETLSILRLEICCWVNFLALAPRLEMEAVAASVSHGLLTCLHRSQTHCESTNEPQSLPVL